MTEKNMRIINLLPKVSCETIWFEEKKYVKASDVWKKGRVVNGWTSIKTVFFFLNFDNGAAANQKLKFQWKFHFY